MDTRKYNCSQTLYSMILIKKSKIEAIKVNTIRVAKSSFYPLAKLEIHQICQHTRAEREQEENMSAATTKTGRV